MDHYDVFISYRRTDVDFATEVQKKLVETSRKVWVDWDNLPPGVEGFTDEIQRGIEGTDAFICILSPNYLESEYCLAELRAALQLKKRVIPIVLCKFEGMAPPEGIGHINWIYFTPHAGRKNTFEESFPKVVQALESDYEHAREHTRLLLRGIDWEKNEKGRSYLLKDAEIGKAERWQVAGISKNPIPTELHGQYILASRANQRKQQRRITALIGILMIMAIVAAISALIARGEAIEAQIDASNKAATAVSAQATAVIAEKEALAQKEVAEKSAQEALISSLAAQSRLVRSHQLGILMALEAYNTSKTKGTIDPSVQTALRSSLVDFSGVPMHDYASVSYFVRYSPDDRWLITSGDNDKVQVSDLSQQPVAPPITLMEEGLTNLVISPDSQWLAGIFLDTTSEKREVRLWSFKDLAAGSRSLDLPADAASVTALAFGLPENKKYWLAAGTEDGGVYTWDVRKLPESEPGSFYKDKYKRSVSVIAFSPDTNWIGISFDHPFTQEIVANPIVLVWNLTNPAGDPIALDLFQSTLMKLEFSSSGKWLAGGAQDGKLRLWNMGVVLTNPSANVFELPFIQDIAFSPDERWLAAAGGAQVTVWNLNGLSQLDLPGYKDILRAITFSPDSKWLATGDFDGQVRFWSTDDFSSGSAITESLSRNYNGFDVIVESLKFRSDGGQLAAAGDHQVRTWDFPVSVSDPVITSHQYYDWNIENTVIVQANENNVYVVDVSNDTPRAILNTVQKKPVTTIYSTNNRYLAVTSSKQLQVWDLTAPKKALFEDELQSGEYVSPIFTADNRWFVYAVNSQIFAFDLLSAGFPILLKGNRNASPIFTLQPFDHWLLSESSSEVLVWDTEMEMKSPTKVSGTYLTGEYQPQNNSSWIFTQLSDTVNIWKAADLSAPVTVKGQYTQIVHDRWLFTITADNIYHLWDLQQPASTIFDAWEYWYSSTENLIIYQDMEETWRLLDLTSADLKPTQLGKLAMPTFIFSDNDQWVAVTQEEDKPAMLYEQKNGFTKVDIAGLTPLGFSPDQHWLLVQNKEGETGLYDLTTRKMLETVYPPSSRFQFSQNNKWAFGALDENNSTSALLIDLQNPGKSYVLKGHTDMLTGMYFTPDGQSLLTYGYDGTIRVWNLSSPNDDPIVLPHKGEVWAATLSANEKYLITESRNSMYIWRWNIEDVRGLACQLIGRNLTEAEWEKYMGAMEYRQTCDFK